MEGGGGKIVKFGLSLRPQSPLSRYRFETEQHSTLAAPMIELFIQNLVHNFGGTPLGHLEGE